MTERTHIPSSAACGQWETLLADALDGLLQAEDEVTFTRHMAGCAACTALFEEARRGREWLEFLSPEPEVPAGLVDRILKHTGPGHAAEAAEMELATAGNVTPLPGAAEWQGQGWHKPGFMGFVQRFAEPRLMMTAAMAFFSIALTLNLTGVRVTSMRLSDLRPTAVRALIERQLTMASVPIVRYYDHLRFVYEFESRMRELRGEPEGEGQPQDGQPVTPGQSRQAPQQTPHKDGGSRVDPPQQSGSPAAEPGPGDDDYQGDYLVASLRLHRAMQPTFQGQPTHSICSALAGRERGMVWIA
jgi:Putative zinc-finger